MNKVLVGGAVVGVIYSAVGFPSKIRGRSMTPTLNPDDSKYSDYIWMSKLGSQQFKYQRGNVVCLVSPKDPKERLIKRIIALEGDTVKTLAYKNRQVTIPEGHCWVEGDSKYRSCDSNIFGAISMGLIQGRATHIIWPPSRIQRLDNRYPEERVQIPPDSKHIPTSNPSLGTSKHSILANEKE
ncbi:mitochondrial inner membrane protease subunit 2 [Lingula anatina]|uniref:Mitochondrial inner membrane protease subunit n=1 Tax=Lingula anatina TaxID=7574 RepID=A0A1S3K9S1_LINAN|nr:mitochondrial inner membrane protease subunit 2 [Lingula anatina]XP_013419195.1 mitochondrial inner membrane protease subunit 2 [Lingula anatina]|eukprot:XP_013419194.1 mitochondrial inner membrane protease subunit 2 [Lingula anatina]